MLLCLPFVFHERRQCRLLTGLLSIAAFLFLVSTVAAQNNNSSSIGHSSGAPSFSASSPAGHVSSNSAVSFSGGAPHSPGHPSHGNGNGNGNPQHHPQRSGGFGDVYYYPYWYPVPYVVDADNADTPDDADDDADYQGGPTVFDRRGSGAASYVPPADSGPAHPDTESAPSETTAADSDPEPAPEPSILVFKDGHRLQVENYAVVGQTLYDLTPGHRRRIALADLDLPATQEFNEDRGIMFLLPVPAQAN